MKDLIMAASKKNILTPLSQTYANSAIFQLVTKKQGRIMAQKNGLQAAIETLMHQMLSLYEQGKGASVDQPTLI